MKSKYPRQRTQGRVLHENSSLNFLKKFSDVEGIVVERMLTTGLSEISFRINQDWIDREG